MTRPQYDGIAFLPRNEEYQPQEERISDYLSAMQDFSRSGISVASVQDEANRKAQDALEGLRIHIVDLAGSVSDNDLVNTRGMLQVLEGLGPQPAFASGVHELIITSMLLAIRERLDREDDHISIARLEQITIDTIRTELLRMDSQRNADGERNWNINLTELNNYRVEHGLPEFRPPSHVAER